MANEIIIENSILIVVVLTRETSWAMSVLREHNSDFDLAALDQVKKEFRVRPSLCGFASPSASQCFCSHPDHERVGEPIDPSLH